MVLALLAMGQLLFLEKQFTTKPQRALSYTKNDFKEIIQV
jgi:hypothetical protein